MPLRFIGGGARGGGGSGAGVGAGKCGAETVVDNAGEGERLEFRIALRSGALTILGLGVALPAFSGTNEGAEAEAPKPVRSVSNTEPGALGMSNADAVLLLALLVLRFTAFGVLASKSPFLPMLGGALTTSIIPMGLILPPMLLTDPPRPSLSLCAFQPSLLARATSSTMLIRLVLAPMPALAVG